MYKDGQGDNGILELFDTRNLQADEFTQFNLQVTDRPEAEGKIRGT